MRSIKKVVELLNRRERINGLILLFFVLLGAVIDVVGVATVMPFVAVLTTPSLIDTHPVLVSTFNFFGFTSKPLFIVALGSMFLGALAFSAALKIILAYAQARFSLMRECSISSRIFKEILLRPYEWHQNKHSTDQMRAVLSEVSQVVQGGIDPLITLATQSTVAFGLIILLIIIDHEVAILAAVFFGGFFFLAFFLTTQKLRQAGENSVRSNQLRFKLMSETLTLLKEVKVAGVETIRADRFQEHSFAYARAHTLARVLSATPRLFLEFIAFGGIILFCLYLFIYHGGLQESLPLISLYIFSGYRLLPAFQHIYSSLSQLRYLEATINSLHSQLPHIGPSRHFADESPRKHYSGGVELCGVSYSYPGALSPVLQNLSMTIKAGAFVGFVGESGSGKSTTINLILGLLRPQSGQVLIDGARLSPENTHSWQRSVGLVQQNINLVDDTVAANIAFGDINGAIDIARVHAAAKAVQIHDFIDTMLPYSYLTVLGEQGSNLSGGQRQRIGIARALYNSPSLLILDEATSALDVNAEQAVLSCIESLRGSITVIFTSHRVASLRACDEIFMFRNASVDDSGSFAELTSRSHHFRSLLSQD